MDQQSNRPRQSPGYFRTFHAGRRAASIALLALLFLGWVSAVHAVTLGQARVTSYLNQPLEAELELVGLEPGQHEDLRIRIANQAQFDRLGIVYTNFLADLRFDVVQSGARWIVRVRSNQPVNEPFLDFPVQMTWPGGQMVRQYTLLLDPLTLRRSEDSFVDEIVAAAPEQGAPLIMAQFPRAYLDVNREPWELDPDMFKDPLPSYVNTRSLRVAGGIGTIAKVVSNGADIYSDKLDFAEAERRVRDLYEPYHAAVRALLDRTFTRFGFACLIDCHSMPSIGGPMDQDHGTHRADIVLGDRYGTSCAPSLVDFTARSLRGLGYVVTRNNPYAGGYTTEHYGRPTYGVHAVQIEINRRLYMDERQVTRGPGLAKLARDMARFIESLHGLERQSLLPTL